MSFETRMFCFGESFISDLFIYYINKRAVIEVVCAVGAPGLLEQKSCTLLLILSLDKAGSAFSYQIRFKQVEP